MDDADEENGPIIGADIEDEPVLDLDGDGDACALPGVPLGEELDKALFRLDQATELIAQCNDKQASSTRKELLKSLSTEEDTIDSHTLDVIINSALAFHGTTDI